VRPGHEPFYDAFLAGIIAAAREFDGHLGVEVFRPAPGGDEYRVVYRFESAAHLQAWMDSDIHAAWLRRAVNGDSGCTDHSLGGHDDSLCLAKGVATDPPTRTSAKGEKR
jgi:antibiotic biosynthesis monooxygenase (ABM) superfamily enzyme